MKFADMHCDTISELYRKKKLGSQESLYENSGHIDLKKLKAGGALLQNFALFVNRERAEDPMEEALEMADLYYEELAANSHLIAPVRSYGDIEENRREGRISALLTVEEGGVCKGSPAQLRNLYRLGVRMMTLTWNYPNEIGYPAFSAQAFSHPDGDGALLYKKADMEHGLTERGRELVAEMERMGMIIDVSHLSDRGFYDVLEVTGKPFVASHSNARAVCPWVRNLTDDMIRRLAERGGVIGLNFCSDFLAEAAMGQPVPDTLEAVAAHAEHIIRVGGVECLGLGSDFDGIPTPSELPDYSYMPRLAEALENRGMRQGDMEKIFSGNVLRVYREVI
ncbi:MAG: dipeptidase [Lachnospiraceae bacterium]|nr:dipeptidase [Lachnospiraceae bacterium]